MRPHLVVALERGRGIDIGLLQLDAPIAEIVEGNVAAGHGAAHEIAGRQHLHLAVEILDLGLALEGAAAFETIHQGSLSSFFSPLSVTIQSSDAIRPARSKAVSPAFRGGGASAGPLRLRLCA